MRSLTTNPRSSCFEVVVIGSSPREKKTSTTMSFTPTQHQLSVHADIRAKLFHFHAIRKIPNLLFHGPSGSGKHVLVHEFIQEIYHHDKDLIKKFVMHENCAHGRGIKFIRDDLKFFAKTHIQSHCGQQFKTVILLNADKLTMDAQSALRRCIELFSHNTRFFLIAENKFNIMKPILSRFCEIHVPPAVWRKVPVHLHQHHIRRSFALREHRRHRVEWLKKELLSFAAVAAPHNVVTMAAQLYERAYAAVDVMQVLKETSFAPETFADDPSRRWELLLCMERVRREFRNEPLLLLFLLHHWLLVSSGTSLENIAFM